MPVVRLAAKKEKELTGKELAAQRAAEEEASSKIAQDAADALAEDRPPWAGVGAYALDLDPVTGPYAKWPLFLAYNTKVALPCTRIVVNDTFNMMIIGVICLAGILVGISTYYDEANPPVSLEIMDIVILSIFMLECIIKIFSEGTRWWRYFTGPEWRWNNFDFLIVVLCIPGVVASASFLPVLRLLRLMRVAKLIKKIPELNMIVMGLVGGFKSIAYILLLLFLIFYLYAIVGMMLFKKNDPWHFGSLEISMLTLFRMSTLEDWTEVMYISWEGCKLYPNTGDLQYVATSGGATDVVSYNTNNASMAEGATAAQRKAALELLAANARGFKPCKDEAVGALSTVFSVTFIMISALVMMSLFVGAITMSMSEALGQMNDERKEKQQAKQLAKKMAKLDEQGGAKGGSKGGRSSPEKSGGSAGEATDGERDGAGGGDERSIQLEQKDRKAMTAMLRRAWGGVNLLRLADDEAGDELLTGWRRHYAHAAHVSKVIADSKVFQNTITFAIILAGILVGVQTNIKTGTPPFLFYMDWIIWVTFFIECAVKTVACKFHPLHFYYHKDHGGLQGWNCFDETIVLLSFPVIALGNFVMVLRLLRLLRVLKLLRALPHLQVIVSALIKGMKSIGFIGVMLVVVYYIFAIVGMILFQKNDPWHFGTLHDALLTLFRVATGEDWTDVMYINMFGCYEYGYLGNGMQTSCDKGNTKGWNVLATFYFIIFIVIGALVMLTLFIGVVTTSMDESTQEMENERKQDEEVARTAARLGIDAPTLQIYKNVFGLLDLDESGTVEEKELKIGLASIGCRPTEPELRAMMDQVDDNYSGEIEMSEFVRFMVIFKRDHAHKAPQHGPNGAVLPRENVDGGDDRLAAELAALDAELEGGTRGRTATFGAQLEEAQGGDKVHSEDDEVAAADDEAAARRYAQRQAAQRKKDQAAAAAAAAGAGEGTLVNLSEVEDAADMVA